MHFIRSVSIKYPRKYGFQVNLDILYFFMLNYVNKTDRKDIACTDSAVFYTFISVSLFCYYFSLFLQAYI
jgi:hypothetical protein